MLKLLGFDLPTFPKDHSNFTLFGPSPRWRQTPCMEGSIEKCFTRLDKEHCNLFIVSNIYFTRFRACSVPVLYSCVILCCTLINFSLNYRDAFLAMRRHRINLNLIRLL